MPSPTYTTLASVPFLTLDHDIIKVTSTDLSDVGNHVFTLRYTFDDPLILPIEATFTVSITECQATDLELVSAFNVMTHEIYTGRQTSSESFSYVVTPNYCNYTPTITQTTYTKDGVTLPSRPSIISITADDPPVIEIDS